ncbi:MAG: hypothetical protein HWE13_01685 [Gammaproteobacteria bacterium]|nr:hypothetical protein [Gammaproteobacteria bacterium]NVK86802.1 hypothetical protein [Gammaproteobacteria bacterium]
MKKSAHLEMSQFALKIFADDGKLDLIELDTLINIALRDHVITDEEKRVLRSILDRLKFEDLTKELILKIEQLEKLYDF